MSAAESSQRPLQRHTATIIHNPQAGPGQMASALRDVTDFWRSLGWQIDLVGTTYSGHARELAAQAAALGRHLVFAAGGDGTINEVADGLAGSDSILAVLPAGTGNSLAKEWSMPRRLSLMSGRLMEVAQALSKGRVQRVDLGQCNEGRHWLQWASVGVDSYLVEQIEPRPKLLKRFGSVAYAGQALWTVPNYPTVAFRVRVDGRLYTGHFLLVTITNCRRYAGGELLLSPGSYMDDGQFEVWLVRGQGITDVVALVAQIWRGQHLRNPDVLRIAGTTVSIETDRPMSYHLDGEPVGKVPVTCLVRPGALRVLVPETAAADLFQHAGEPLL
jgi:YegS/Rv2252/BmrU family lipid kinase